MRYIEIELDGKVKQLRYDFNAIADMEERMGKGVGAIFNEQNVGFNTLRLFYWAGLKWKDKGITVERAGDMLQKEIENGSDIGELMEPVLKALKLSGVMGKSQDEEETEGKN
jgi:hypothetical protein